MKKNQATAIEWYHRAANQGHSQAQYNLGVVFAFGKGVPKNNATAVEWYRRAAENGSAQAQTNLGVMYEQGKGVAKDEVRSRSFVRSLDRVVVTAVHDFIPDMCFSLSLSLSLS